MLDAITSCRDLRPGNVRPAHGPLHAGWTTPGRLDNTAGEAALKKGYGKDAFVNGMLAAFWGTAARRGWRPQFARVESKANVADAVSRGDLSRARNEGWTRLHDNTDSITSVLVMAAADAEYAASKAVDDLQVALN